LVVARERGRQGEIKRHGREMMGGRRKKK